MMDIICLDTCISDTSNPIDLNTKKLFVSYLLIAWIMTRWINGNNRILTITRITWITHFLFISCLDQFCLYFPKSNVNGIARKRKWQKFETKCNQMGERNQIYVIKWASGLCEWPLLSLTQWLDQLDHQSSFVCVSVSRITWINGSVIHSSKQIAPNKCQAYRMKILSLTLSFSYREHYIVVSDLVRFWYNFSLVHFSGRAIFRVAIFQGAYFRGVIFRGAILFGFFSGGLFSRGHFSWHQNY